MKCPHCPRTHPDCPGEKARRLCDLANPDHPAYRPEYRVTLANHAISEAENPTVAESMDLLNRMKSCAFRSVDPGCGCSGGRCSLRSAAIVGYADCFACLKAYG